MESKPVPHVLLFPFPSQSHVNSMLQLAELLSLSHLHVTFLNTNHYHHRLLRFTDAGTRFSSFPNFRFETISDGLPDDHPRSVDNLADLFRGIITVTKPAFEKLLLSDQLNSDHRPPVTCIILDGLLIFPIYVAKELGIPSIVFRATSACHLWSCFHYRNLMESNHSSDADMDELINCIPGMENFLRRRDLPDFSKSKMFLQHISRSTIEATKASASILNTFEDLEAPVISEMTRHFPKIYAIGPLHAHLNTRRSIESRLSITTNSLWEVDRSCMTWLDDQPSKSVVYVSFGSVLLMSQSHMLEFWHGLVNSGKRFLWVMRPESIVDKDDKSPVPTELTEGTKERGYMVGWSPQEEVLVHPAVGGFMTHSGWNSTLESIVAGVPMVCSPQMFDQRINSRFVSEVWKVGLDMKDTSDRTTVEKMINNLMDHKRDELMKSMDRISKMALKSVSQGGTSYRNLDALVEDIKMMNL